MFNYLFKLSFRTLLRNGRFSLLNLIGLSIGLASFTLISLYVLQEHSYDQGFSQSNRIYRVNTLFLNGGMFAKSSTNVKSTLEEQPEFQVVTSLSAVFNKTARVNNAALSLNNYYYSDPQFIEVFDFELLHGISKSAFKSENTLVLEAREALRLFGRTNVVGEVVWVDDQRLEVTGVLDLTSYNTHLNFNGLWVKPKTSYDAGKWLSPSTYSYAMALPGVEAEQMTDRLRYINETYIFPSFAKFLSFRSNYTFEDWMDASSRVELKLQPVGDIHFASGLLQEMSEGAERQTVFIFAIVALVILTISAANFINLSTARASERTKELGIKKVLGTSRRALMRQLMIESMILTTIAGFLSLGITELVLQGLAGNYEGFLNGSLLGSPFLVLVVSVTTLLIGVLTGLYPAWYLSSFKVTALLRKQSVKGFAGYKAASFFRNGLVALQFCLSTALIISAIFISRQLDHMNNLDLGFDKDKVWVIKNVHALGEQLSAFRTQLEQLSFVESTSAYANVPGQIKPPMNAEHDLPNGMKTYFQWIQGDYQQFETLSIELKEGRFFSSDQPSDQDNAVIINETAAQLFGDDPVLGASLNGQEIVGVVRDFHMESLRVPIAPMMFNLWDSRGQLGVRMEIRDEHTQQILALWQEFTELEMEHYPLSDNYKILMQQELQIAKIFKFFTLLAIFIACLGMFGLAVYTADQRAKEFSIRKVLGAKVFQLFSLMVQQFFKPILVSVLIAIPASYTIIRLWLAEFAYRTDLSVLVFVLGALIVALLVIVTVSGQSYRIAKQNPSETLKNE